MAFSASKMKFTEASAERQAYKARMLVFADVHDTNDLDLYAKAARVYNGSASALTLALVPLDPETDSPAAILWTIPAGQSDTINMAFRRVKLTDSVNLISGAAIISGIEIVLFQR